MVNARTSTTGRRVLAGIVLLALATALLTGPATADMRVGGSGNCDDGGDDNDYVAGGGDGGELRADGGDAPDSGGSVNGLVNLVQERSLPENEDMCDGIGPSTDGDDYYEVHAEGGGNGVQYCLSDQNDEDGGEVHRQGDAGYDSGDCAYDEDGQHGSD